VTIGTSLGLSLTALLFAVAVHQSWQKSCNTPPYPTTGQSNSTLLVLVAVAVGAQLVPITLSVVWHTGRGFQARMVVAVVPGVPM
jgi:hypothetical protein